MLTLPRHILNATRLRLLQAIRHLAAWVEPRDPAHLSSRLERGEIVWRAFVDAGVALRRCGRFAEADRMLERGLGAFPNDRTLLFEHAMSAHNSGRYAIAITRWEQALRVAPDLAMCHCGLAANFRETGLFDRAQGVIDAALASFPEDLVVVSEAARLADARHHDAIALQLWSKAAGSLAPSPDWIQGEANALLRLGSHVESAAVLKSGLDRFPDHQGLLAVEGLLASTQADWPRALALWAAYRQRFPDDRFGQHEFDQALRASDPKFPHAGSGEPSAPSSADDGTDGESLRHLLLGFESIGDNCEFGTVQRRYAAEPLGLLRWSTVILDKLIPALEQGFAGMGEPENTEMTAQPGGSYLVQDRRWGLGMPLAPPIDPADREDLFVRSCRRIALLKDKLVADLAAAEKIFVYRSEGLDGDRLEALHRALRRFGPVRLLNVQPAAPTAPTLYQGRAGDLLKVDDKRFVGFLERLGMHESGTGDIAFDDWIAVCRKAVALA